MAQAFQWDSRLCSVDTGEFDRALTHLRRNPMVPGANPSVLSELATELRNTHGITRREFDRRFRLVVSVVIEHDRDALGDIVTHLGKTAPEALNALRTLLPVELRHLAIQVRPNSDHPTATAPVRDISQTNDASLHNTSERPANSKFSAVVLIGTSDEHVRNEGMIRNAGLDPLRLLSLEEFWNIAPTGLCGFVVGASAWGPVPQAEQQRAICRICEYSTFIFARICLDGLATDIARNFLEHATAARRGPLDGRKFCHGQDCDLTFADIQILRSIAQLFEKAGKADFFPLGLSESDASLLRLIAADRHQGGDAVTIRKLGTRELAGGRSAARVFLLSDGRTHPFVAKVHDAEELVAELDRYRGWIQEWEPSITGPTFHAHQGSAAISYRLQAAPDSNSQPAPTLEECLEGLRSGEWNRPLQETQAKASDLFQAISRAVDRLVGLNLLSSEVSEADDFWLPWPVQELAARGIDPAIINRDWETLQLSTIVNQAMIRLQPNLVRGVVHGDIHGRNILLVDRLPAFIDFRWSGPGHPLVDLVRLDAAVRTIAMRMILPKQSMFQAFEAIYVEGQTAEQVLAEHSALATSPLTALAVRVAARTRQAALKVANAHSLGKLDYFAMTCVVSAHVFSVRAPGSGVERLLLSVLAPQQ